MDGRSTHRLRFNQNGPTHQQDALVHADQSQSLLVRPERDYRPFELNSR